MSRLIAILSSTEHLGYDDNYTTIANSITEWSEVSDEEFKALQEMASAYYSQKVKYTIVERVDLQPNFIPKTILEFKLFVKKREEARKAAIEKAANEKKLAAQKRKEAKERKLKRAAAEELALFQQLQEKYGAKP